MLPGRKTIARFRGEAILLAVLFSCGCTSFRDYVHNGFKVGPNYHEPDAPVPDGWLNATDPCIQLQPDCLGDCWSFFNDQMLDSLIDEAFERNLDLKTAGFRLLAARADRKIAVGNLLPDQQRLVSTYAHFQISKNLPEIGFANLFDVWADGFLASWEVDFWGKIRRDIETASANLDASIDNYNDVLVLLLAEVASNYVQVRSFQQRLVFLSRNIELQRGSLELAEGRFRNGATTELDVQQARSNLAETEAMQGPLEIGLRQANHRLCELLGVPPADLVPRLVEGAIPTGHGDITIGIPADLLRRRPDIRRAERQVAAQSAQIGAATADLYPQFNLVGFLGPVADSPSKLFTSPSFTGFIAPTFSWKILNYGRVLGNVHKQEALYQARVAEYQQTVIKASREVEDALVAYTQWQDRAHHLEDCVKASERSVKLVNSQYKEGKTDFNRVFDAEAVLNRQQEQLVVARLETALNLIRIYKALGGGWECFPCPCTDRKKRHAKSSPSAGADQTDCPAAEPTEPAGKASLKPRRATKKLAAAGRGS